MRMCRILKEQGTFLTAMNVEKIIYIINKVVTMEKKKLWKASEGTASKKGARRVNHLLLFCTEMTETEENERKIDCQVLG